MDLEASDLGHCSKKMKLEGRTLEQLLLLNCTHFVMFSMSLTTSSMELSSTILSWCSTSITWIWKEEFLTSSQVFIRTLGIAELRLMSD